MDHPFCFGFFCGLPLAVQNDSVHMSVTTLPLPLTQLKKTGIQPEGYVHYQLPPEELVQDTLRIGEGVLNDTGALVIWTGEFTGRSPKDKFIVKDELTEGTVNWNEFNLAIEEKFFDTIHNRINAYLNEQPEIWVRDCMACADIRYRINIRVITEKPWTNLFAYNMFLRPSEEELERFRPEWTILCAPDLKLDATECGIRQHNVAVIHFRKKMILIAGTGYTGETKKGIFSILNYILPHERNVLSMHCAANIGRKGDTALFFGLSGTGKTTLSADPERNLIGDDEHGWAQDTIFNFEGGCYAKTIDLSEEKEPAIFHAIRPGALVENTTFYPGTNTIDFSSKKITENTRVSYPLHFVDNAQDPAIGGSPRNIFFLTCDAFGILPPIARLTPEQAMYQFISGYTAKVAGTETGITEPKSTFSACFGAPFLPLHPGKYARMLGTKLKSSNANVWLINTGWTGGAYGTGSRMKLAYTRALITAALEGKLDQAIYDSNNIFGFAIPLTCPNVPAEILNPRNTWSDKDAYDSKAKELAQLFISNFKKYEAEIPEAVKAAGPSVH